MACQNVKIEQITTTVQVGACSIIVRIPHCGPAQGAANPPGALDLLEYYDSDEEAKADGLVAGQYYRVRTTGGNLGLKRGTPVEVE